MPGRVIVMILSGIMTMVFGLSVASAQESEGKRPPGAKKAQAVKRGPQRVIEMETMEVVGKGQKPRVYYLIGRGEMTYDGLPMERNMSNEIEESVKRPPF